MTIATFCRDELLAHGPLTLDDLAARASHAGVTRSSDPRAAVRQAMHHRELELDHERWVTPLWLLEGRCLTTPALGIPEWTCDPRDTSQYDLGLLERAANLAPLKLVGGGTLSRRSLWGPWKSSVRLPEPRHGELLCFRVTGGAVEVTKIPAVATDVLDAVRVKEALDTIAPRRGVYSWNACTAVNQRLAELVLTNDTLLRSPVPPLSVCSALLAEEVARIERARDAEYADPWWDEPSHADDPMDAVELRAWPPDRWLRVRP